MVRDRGIASRSAWFARRLAPVYWPARRRTDRQEPDEASVRRVGRRLAALTVGLLCALLLALGVVVYLSAQNVLYDSLQQTIRRPADAAAQFLALAPPPQRFRTIIRPPTGRESDFRRLFLDANDAGGVSLVVVDHDLRVLSRISITSARLLDPAAARQALRGGAGSPYTTSQINANGPYLIYTVRVTRHGDTPLVVQTSISERLYRNSLQALLRILLGVSALGLLASAGISALLVRRALAPIRVSLRRQRDFVADAAHELRTPLAIMRSATELGLSSEAVGEQQAALEQTLAQNAHLTRLVDDLSTLARADSGAIGLQRAPFDLSRLVVETVEGIEALAEDRDVRLSVDASEELCIDGDAGRLRQLLLILLDNALKYTPAGGFVRVGVERQGGQARLAVCDSGPGIAPADLPRLFDRFYRADRAREGEGFGLGLAIGRWIAEAHGGGITAANAPDRGALFTVSLPLSR